VPRGERVAEDQIAVCSLSSRELVAPLSALPGVALAGTLMTANLGIEELLRTLARRPAIRGLVVCGKESPRFLAGQSLLALFRDGVDPERRRIVGAAGYLPVLRSVPLHEVERLRARVEVVDARGERDPLVLGEIVRKLRARLRAARPPAPDARAASADGRPAGGGSPAGGGGAPGGWGSARSWTGSW
jgi:tetrahydromethanopterin S-methyltransferase subunit A